MIGTYNYTEYKKPIDSHTGVEKDVEKTSTNSVNYSNLPDNKKSDYGQLLYYTPRTQKQEIYSDTEILKYNDCTTSIEPADPDAATGTEARYKTQNVLKSYMPYSARYVQEVTHGTRKALADLNVIYTLDNYVTIEGSFTYDTGTDSARSIYYTKSGYLLPFTADSLSVRFQGDGFDYDSSLDFSEDEIQTYIESGRPITVQVLQNLDDSTSWETIIEINNTNRAVIDKRNINTDSDSSKLTRFENALFALEEAIANPVPNPDEIDNAINNATTLLTEAGSTAPMGNNAQILEALRLQINDIKYRIQLNSSAVYYAKAAIFSKWVKDNLSELEIRSIQDISGLNYTTYIEEFVHNTTGEAYNFENMWDSSEKVFEFTDGIENCGTTEIKHDSTFYNHKIDIIRSSIQYNLNLAMSSYNRHLYYNDDRSYAYNRNTDYTMPIMKENEWDQILTNISIVSFMQGIECGLKTYNNYVVVSSSNNEIMTTPNNIYYTNQENFNDEQSEYHKYNCRKVLKSIESPEEGDTTDYTKRMSFTSKEVKYDKITSRSTIIPYTYDHKNLACYECINDGNYRGEDIFDTSSDSDAKYAMRKAYYIGVAKERNDVYKMNAVTKSEGYEILYFADNISEIDSTPVNAKNTSSLLGMNKIKEIEVVFGAVDTVRRDESTLTFDVSYNGRYLRTLDDNPAVSLSYDISTNTVNKSTWNIKVDPHIGSYIGMNKLFNLGDLIFELHDEHLSSFMEDATEATPSDKLKKSIVGIRVIYK